ncbi:hypothetical protein BGZ60DRAFT_432764 [Tricladium varicosporioides]|nr:hypothetical protein BGZ60DRAFT_432764 [Hymenoscyphus varicosporioides]
MLFSSVSISVLGFAAVSFAAPHLHSRFEITTRDSAAPAERGLTWTPKRGNGNGFSFPNSFNTFGNNQFFNDFSSFQQQTTVVITEIQENSFSNSQFQQEQEFSQLIQEQLFLQQQQTFFCDNIRRNHFNSRNNQVNTVILIVQQVQDNRFGQSNTRYFTRQIQSNSNIRQQQVVIIQEQTILQIGGNSGNSLSQFAGGEFVGGSLSGTPTSEGSAQATESATPSSEGKRSNGFFQRGIYVPGASWQGFNPNIQLLPFGIQQPSFGFGSAGIDPALIIQSNQQVFISFVQQSQQVIDSNVFSGSPFDGFNSISNII